MTKKEIDNLSFQIIGAAIEANMANEIFNQLQDGQLTNAANLNNDAQLYNVVNWIIRK